MSEENYFGSAKERLDRVPWFPTHSVKGYTWASYHPEEPTNQDLIWACPSCKMETRAASSGKPIIFPVSCYCGAEYVVRVKYK